MADITGIVNGTTANPQIKSRLVWEETTDAATNTGSVTVALQLRTTTGYVTYSGDSDFYIRINGTTYSTISIYKSIGAGEDWVTCYTKTVTGIVHNVDGTKSIAISGWGDMYGTSVSTITVGATITLYAIPRASAFTTTSSVEVNGTNAVAVTITRLVSTYTHTVDIYTGANYAASTYKQRYTGVGTSQSYAIPTTWRLAMPTTTSMTARVTVTTYSGATQIGDAVTRTFTLTVPSTVKPVLHVNGIDGGNITTYPSQPSAIAEFEHYVQGYSGIKAVFRNLAAIFESEVALAKFFVIYAGVKSEMSPDAEELDTVYAKDASGNAVVLQTAGVYSFTVGVTDARGAMSTANVSVTVYDYDNPSLSGIDVYRCNSSGVASDTGLYMSVEAKSLFTSLGSENAITYLRVRYKATSSGTYGTWSNMTSETPLVLGAGAILTTQSYDVQLYIADTVGNSSTMQAVVPTAAVAFNIKDGGRAVGFGKFAETEELADFDYPIKAPDMDVATHRLKTYTAVSQLGFTAGVPTINEVYSAMPYDSELSCYAGEFLSTEVPSLFGAITLSKANNINRGHLVFWGKEEGGKTYRQYLLSNGTFSGIWLPYIIGIDMIWPVNSIYMSVASTSPATLFGGTWERIQDMFLLAAGTTFSAGATGGAATHTLTVGEMPAHTHEYFRTRALSSEDISPDSGSAYAPSTATADRKTEQETYSTGGGTAHNNMPPYLAVYVWKRTA